MKRRIKYLTVAFVAICAAAWAQTYREIPNSVVIGGGIRLVERADHAFTPAAGFGEIWVRSSDNALVYTGEGGTDTALGAGGGGSFSSSDITGKTAVTPEAGDYVIGTDGSDSDALKKFDVSAFLAGSGDVTGPGATVTDDAVATFDGTGGLTIQQSPVTIAQSTGNMAGVGTLNGNTIPAGPGTFALTSGLHSAVTVSGTPNYITLSGQDLIRALINLGSHVTGTLPIANGGTGLTAVGTANQVLATNAGATAVEWQTVTGNATHTGDMAGSTTLTAQNALITGKSTVTAVSGDSFLLSDASDSGNLKKALLSDISAIITGLTDSQISDTLTASLFVGSGSSTTAVDLATAEVAGDLPFANLTQIGQYEILGRVASGTGDAKPLTRVEQDTLREVETELSSSSNATAWNSDGVRFFHDTLTENTTVSANSGTARTNQYVQFRFTAATGSDYTLSWNSLFAAGSGAPFGGVIPSVTTVDGRQSVYLYQYRGSKFWLCAYREDN